MSKINAVRMINLNYNNNAIRVSDETFHMNGESTLISLRNGGGKSVLVQMMMAPFLHKRYRDIKDRPFESYFTTNKPTFIMVEWKLDQGAGYVLTGMMVRKSQEVPEEHEEQKESLEIINFISEYQGRCMQDIHHLPVVEKVKKEITLKNFGACKQLFESYKRDRSIQFFYYDMGNQAQQKQYFDKLSQYQIYYKEWETIIKKVNLKESGLSDLFADCKDEKGLVEKWLLDAVESKLNKDKNRMKEFQTIVEKYVGQYKDNKSKIERRDTIRRFREESQKISGEASTYEQVTAQVLSFEQQIAGFIKELGRLCGCEGETLKEIQNGIEVICQKRTYLDYEELSKEFHEWKKQELYHCSNMEMIGNERDALEAECKKIEQVLHRMQCAKEQELVEDNRRDLLQVRQKLVVAKQKEEDLEPEREKIGYTLKLHYEELCTQWEEKRVGNEEARMALSGNIAEGRTELSRIQTDILEETKEIAGGQVKLQSFDEREERFNRRYEEHFVRNILGEYEPGMLDIEKSALQKELAQTERERMTMKKKLDASEEEKRVVQRRIEDRKQTNLEHQLAMQDLERTKTLYETELKERQTVMKYLDVEETALFDTEKILSVSARKLGEIERSRREFEKDEEVWQQEYVRLTQGKVLELPEEFKQILEHLGLNYVYGMEWLKRNGYTTKENQKLVETHPFLPYALLLSGQDMERLLSYVNREDSKKEAAVYTSFPIPIILREQLDKEGETQRDGVIAFSGVQFYVAFNGNLLDEEMLAQMVAEKEVQIRKLQAIIEQKRSEYTDYFEKHERVRNQKVTQKDFEDNQSLMKRTKEESDQLAREIRQMQEDLANLEKQMEEDKDQIQRLGVQIDKLIEKSRELDKFCEAYTAYLEEAKELARREKQVKRLQEQLRLREESIEKLQNELLTLEHVSRDILRKSDELKTTLTRYAEFAETICAEGKPEDLEARYIAITAGMSSELKDLTQQADECGRRFDKSVEALAYLQEKYQLEEPDWNEIIYNRKEEQHQETLLEDRQKKVMTKTFQYNEEDKTIAVLGQRLTEQRKKIKERCQREEPLAKEAIITEDFEAERNKLIYEEKEQRKQAELVSRKLTGYESNLTSLAEYSDLEMIEEIVWDTDFTTMGRKELDAFKGMLVRDYRQGLEKRQECRNRLNFILNQILRMEEFQEDFYRKPLESLLVLSDNASQVLAQLDTTIQSYDSLIQKLEVDISVVEKEKGKIVELLLDYIKEVHDNMGKIDHNSTITIRERPVKMLKINLPDWEENEAIFEVRLQDFIDELTQKGMEIFEANENAQEYFGTRITTRHLYDTVIGIGNVQIRLYKVEEMREYPITWTDVARNSGGEGFLSAFVILSSLLYYMRRDDSDIFADRNEGKVLVMDNPFAQTNAAHLLKPLMDMAKKANTQLICLSGLGGESIYNRFDNIYVLNLIAASLRSGMQYLRTEHTKGTEGETVIASQIEVVQQEMLF